MLYRCSVFHSSVLLLYINNYVMGRGRVRVLIPGPSVPVPFFFFVSLPLDSKQTRVLVAKDRRDVLQRVDLVGCVVVVDASCPVN